MLNLEIHYPDGLVGEKAVTEEKTVYVGSDAGCQIQIKGPGVQGKHFGIGFRNGAYLLQCNKGVTDVKVNGKPASKAILNPGDEVVVGKYRIVVQEEAKAGFTRDIDGLDALSDGDEAPRPAAVRSKKIEQQYVVPIYQSPLFLGISGALGILAVAGVLLWFLVLRASAHKHYDTALKDYGDGQYAKAIVNLDIMLKDYPKSEYEDRGQFFRAMANVRQHSDSSAPALDNALKALKELVQNQAKNKVFQTNIDDVGGLTLQIATAFADAAKKDLDPKAVTSAEEAIGILSQQLTASKQPQDQVDLVQSTLVEARFLIEKENIRQATLKRMDEALAQENPMVIYAEHRKLYWQYSDLKADADCQERRAKAREVERKQVVFQKQRSEGGAVSASAPPPAHVAVRRVKGNDALKKSGRIVCVPVADTVYAIDSGSGAMAWQHPIGYHPAFAPVPLPDDPSRTLVHRPRDNAILVVESASGKDVWSQSLAGAKLEWPTQPVFANGNVYLTATEAKAGDKGRIFVFSTGNGDFVGQYVMPQALSAAPVVDLDRQTLLVAGKEASLYNISLNTHACEPVFATDHEVQAIRSTPLMAGRFLFLAECRGLHQTRLRCLVVSAGDGSIKERQVQDLHGWVWHRPVVTSGRLFVTTDQDHYSIFALGDERDPKPLTVMLRTTEAFESPSDPPFPLTATERDFWRIARQIRWLQFNPENQQIDNEWEQDLGGLPATAPRIEGTMLVVATQHPVTGVVQVAGFDTAQRAEVWRVELGELPAACQPDPTDPNALLVVRGTRAQKISSAELLKETLAEEPPIERKIGEEDDSSVPYRTLTEWTDGVFQWTGIGGDQLKYLAPSGERRRYRAPGKVSAKPTVFGAGILLPAREGMLYWIDPKTSAELAEPWIGPFDAGGEPVPLVAATGLDATSCLVVAGDQLFRIVVEQQGSVKHFKRQSSVKLAEPRAGQLVNFGGSVLLTLGDKLIQFKPDSLQTVRDWPLGAPVSEPAVPVEKSLLLVNDLGEIICVGEAENGLDIRWKASLPARPIGPPIPKGDRFWLAYSDGRVAEHNIADGKATRELAMGRAIFSGPWLLGERIAILAPDGSIVGLDLQNAAAATTAQREP